MPKPLTQADAAREAARTAGGQFGEQHHGNPGQLVLGDRQPTEQEIKALRSAILSLGGHDTTSGERIEQLPDNLDVEPEGMAELADQWREFADAHPARLHGRVDATAAWLACRNGETGFADDPALARHAADMGPVEVQLDEDIVRVFPAAQAVVEDAPEDEDEESCYECGASLDDGEGYDGLCGNCADAAEPHSCENCGFTYSTGEGSGAACCENPVDAGW